MWLSHIKILKSIILYFEPQPHCKTYTYIPKVKSIILYFSAELHKKLCCFLTINMKITNSSRVPEVNHSMSVALVGKFPHVRKFTLSRLYSISHEIYTWFCCVGFVCVWFVHGFVCVWFWFVVFYFVVFVFSFSCVWFLVFLFGLLCLCCVVFVCFFCDWCWCIWFYCVWFCCVFRFLLWL